MEPIIKIENLSVAYDLGKSTENWALKDVSLEIYPQEYIIFLGPSGCGKSTLLYTIAGLEYPTKGGVIVNGKNLKHLAIEEMIKYHKAAVGMVFQAFYLIPNLNVMDNILLPQIFADQPVSKRIQKTQILMQRFGLLNLKSRMAYQLSGGQQQRVAIARALVNNAPLILADEPVGNLDSKNADIIIDLLAELNEKDKKTIIHVTHDPKHLYHANRVFYMKDGAITRVVRNPEKMAATALNGKNEAEISELERIAQAYPYLSETKLKAKMILNHLLYPYGIEVQEKIEKLIDQYLQKKIDERQIRDIFDSPVGKGGVNLYKQTADAMTKKIAQLAHEISLMEEEITPSLTPVEEKIAAIRRFLLDKYPIKLSFDQIKRLEKTINQRVFNKYRKKDFETALDQPFSKGGVGLNRRTAKKITREVELILMRR